ncbi:nuclease-related domain-containing protein [Streptococcus sp. ZJ93]|uniref:nuclease-related domain-containing protein n=1 Tax=Streptococcus handemini TaxID=3161188 RepID=UPI0032F034C1
MHKLITQIIEYIQRFFNASYQKEPKSQPKILKVSSQKGKSTGYEPYRLEKYNLQSHELMYGTPGQGLTSSGFSSDAINLGQQGEVNFAKALQKRGLLDRLLTFWSVHNLGLYQEKIDADVDCIVVSATTIWLIDLKFYASGDVTYRVIDDKLYTIDNQTEAYVGQPKKMSHNMANAHKRFQEKFGVLTKYFQLKSCVVLMPTNKGEGILDSVSWPGNIPAMNLREMLAVLEKEDQFVDTIGAQKVKQTFQVLTKRK